MCPARSVTIQAREFVGDHLMIRRRRQATPPVPLNGSEADITMTGGLHLRHEHYGTHRAAWLRRTGMAERPEEPR